MTWSLASFLLLSAVASAAETVPHCSDTQTQHGTCASETSSSSSQDDVGSFLQARVTAVLESVKEDPDPVCSVLCAMVKLGDRPVKCIKAKSKDACMNSYYKKAGKATFCKWKPSGKCQGGSTSASDCAPCGGGGNAPTPATSGPTVPTGNTIPNSDKTASSPCKTHAVAILFEKFRFRTLGTRNAKAGTVQLSELQFQDANEEMLQPLKMTNPDGKSPKGEDASKANDGKTSTKWSDRKKSPLIATFGTKKEPAKFRFVTALDKPESDPSQWMLEGQSDDGNWVALHEQKDIYNAPSDRKKVTEWFDLEASRSGQECHYECNDGFVKWGRHVYQSYSAGGHTLIDSDFAGGSCQPLCEGGPACSDSWPLRYKSDDGACLETKCFLSKNNLLKELARGNYEMWDHARNPKTGLYMDSLQVLKPEQKGWGNGNTGMAGLGLVVEAIGHAMGFASTRKAQRRMLQTLESFGKGKKKVPRKDLGLVSGKVNTQTGQVGEGPGQVGNTGFLMSGVLFSKTYWESADPGSKQTKDITDLANKLFDSVEWAKILCNSDGKLDNHGDRLPFLVDNGGICKNVHTPDKRTGLFEVDELYIAVWLMYYHTCGKQDPSECANQAVAKLWEGHQGRKTHEIFGKRVLVDWGSYATQLNFYLAGAFNSDPQWVELFKNQYETELEFYKTSLYYGDEHHYGLAAGPTMKLCANNNTYIADRLWDPKEKPDWSVNCRTWSPYAVAGYMPVDKDRISDQIAAMLASGEAVTTFQDMNGKRRFILNRRSLLFPTSFEPWQTMVDISEEMFGLGFYFLGMDWWNKNTDYFKVL